MPDINSGKSVNVFGDSSDFVDFSTDLLVLKCVNDNNCENLNINLGIYYLKRIPSWTNGTQIIKVNHTSVIGKDDLVKFQMEM